MTRRQKWLAIIGVSLLFLILILVVPIRQVPHIVYEQYPITETYTAKEPYIDTEAYYEWEPYTATETYYVQVPVQKLAPLTYSATGKGFTWYTLKPGFRAWVYLKNTDSQAGIFQVDFTLNLFGGGQTGQSAGAYLQPGEQKKVEVSYAGRYLDSFKYSVAPPNKTVTVYESRPTTRPVEKWRRVRREREVVKYRDAPKERIVWKTRPVTQYKWRSIIGVTW